VLTKDINDIKAGTHRLASGGAWEGPLMAGLIDLLHLKQGQIGLMKETQQIPIK
jgi:hypothetical protein